MRTRDGAVLASLERVAGFLDRHAELLASVVKSTGRQLRDAVQRFGEHGVSQDAATRATRGETANQRALRATLRFSHMRPIADMAKLNLDDYPTLTALMLPPSNAATKRLVTAAVAMADMAASHETVLVDSGLPADFIARLRKAAADVEASIAARDESRSARTGATAGLAAQTKRGRALLRVLDSFITPLLGSNDALLREWATAKHIQRVAEAHPAASPNVAA